MHFPTNLKYSKEHEWVRLEGNNVQAGNATLAQSGLTIIRGDSMAEAAQKAVEAVSHN